MTKPEYFNGNEWKPLDSGAEVNLEATPNSNIPVSGSLTISEGSVEITLGDELEALAVFSDVGFMVRKGAGDYTARNLTSGDGLIVTNPDGISDNPNIAFDNTIMSFDNTSGSIAVPLTIDKTITVQETATFNSSVNVAGILNMNNQIINNVANPTNSQDAATKAYVDNHAIMHGAVSAIYTNNDNIGDHIKFDNILYEIGSGIVLDTTSPYRKIVNANVPSVGRIELTNGRIYKLTGSLGPVHPDDEIAIVQWYRITDTSEFALGSNALFSDNHGSTGPAVAYVDLINDIPVGTKTIYELRITSDFGRLDDEGSLPWFTIETII